MPMGLPFLTSSLTDFGAVEEKLMVLLFEALPAEALGNVVEDLDLGLVKSGLLFDDLLYVFIGEAMVGVDDRFPQPMMSDLPLRRHLEDGGEGELVLVGTGGSRVRWRSSSGSMGLTRSGR